MVVRQQGSLQPSQFTFYASADTVETHPQLLKQSSH